ncbi:winged helix-turn-helix domain-containing protein [Enterobacter roggenkampii]|uniref:winged helix-turn-helix domain-containing protein n=1 Tax=Enterobacter roggenkampii TaxID=1812935 RepID=UPI001237EB1B|nr:winged helix-turn-helix domain-containing protein [Enterobacter roggenkampii]
MKPVFLINHVVLFEPDKRRLCQRGSYPERAVVLHGPVSECLLQLLEHNGEVLSQRYLFAAVWEKQGAVVTTNALYQTIASIRKALKMAGLTENIVQTIPKEGFKSVAHIQMGSLEDFITPAVLETVSTFAEAQRTSSPSVNHGLHFFLGKMAWVLAGLLFVASCLALIHEINAQRAGLEDYLSIGNVNGCDVYSSWHDKTESQHIFAALEKRYPVHCPPGSVALMTLNRFQNGISVLVCDRLPNVAGARCDSIMYLEHYHESE